MRAGIVVLGFGFSLLSLGALADKVLEVPPGAPAEPVTLRLVWVDVRGAGHTIRTEAMAETAAIFEASGVHVRWDSSDGRQRRVRDGEIQVVLLAAAAPPMPPDVMGSAYPGARGVRTVWVFLGGVRTALGYDSRRREMPRPGESQTIGRAVGRVIVHEIVHLIAPDRPHSDAGLMAPRLGRRMLVPPRLRLEAGLGEILHRAASLARSDREAGGVRTVLAGVRGDEDVAAVDGEDTPAVPPADTGGAPNERDARVRIE